MCSIFNLYLYWPLPFHLYSLTVSSPRFSIGKIFHKIGFTADCAEICVTKNQPKKPPADQRIDYRRGKVVEEQNLLQQCGLKSVLVGTKEMCYCILYQCNAIYSFGWDKLLTCLILVAPSEAVGTFFLT